MSSWYHVGEPERMYGSYDEFVARSEPSGSEISEEEREERDLSGICSRVCIEVLSEDTEEQNAKGGRTECQVEGWIMRRTTAQEQAGSGVQFVWEKTDERRGGA